MWTFPRTVGKSDSDSLCRAHCPGGGPLLSPCCSACVGHWVCTAEGKDIRGVWGPGLGLHAPGCVCPGDARDPLVLDSVVLPGVSSQLRSQNCPRGVLLRGWTPGAGGWALSEASCSGTPGLTHSRITSSRLLGSRYHPDGAGLPVGLLTPWGCVLLGLVTLPSQGGPRTSRLWELSWCWPAEAAPQPTCLSQKLLCTELRPPPCSLSKC